MELKNFPCPRLSRPLIPANLFRGKLIRHRIVLLTLPILGITCIAPAGRAQITAGQLKNDFVVASAADVKPPQTIADQTDPPIAQVSATSLQFGTLDFPSTEYRFLTIANIGGGTLTYSPSVNGPSYNVSNSSCPTAGVPAGTSCDLQVVYSPVQVGLHNDYLTINNNGATVPVVHLLGSATGISVVAQDIQNIALSLPDVLFGTIAANSSESRTLTIISYGIPGTTPLRFVISGPSYTIPDATNGCSAGVSEAQSCQIIVLYKPTATGTHNDELTAYPANSSDSFFTIRLVGSAD